MGWYCRVVVVALVTGVVACGSDDPQRTGDAGPGDADDSSTGDAGTDDAPDVPDDTLDVATEVDSDAADTSIPDDREDAAPDTSPEYDCVAHDPLLAPEPTPPRHTPRWAFRPWISKDISDRDDTFGFVDGFREREIPVGVVVLDSPWETNYNTFIPNPSRYPDFGAMVAELREQDVRVVLWTTQLVNEYSFDFEIGGDVYDGPASNFAEGQACGYFVNEGQTWPWWKGQGAAVDFFHSGARAWWHAQQDALLDMGVAGWKLDFGDEYIAAPTVRTATGELPRQQYSEEYYRDFLAHGVARSGVEEFVTMVRPYDRSYQFAGRFFARPEHAPVAWVGDNRRDWFGFVDSLDHLFRSAQAGYVVIGSDIGGYLDRDDQNIAQPIAASDPTFYAWTGTSAFLPFFQLHGRANLEPWNYGADPELTVRIYRYWATLHDELVPFFYSLAVRAHELGDVLVEPVVSDEAGWADDWRFVSGRTFLVAPPLNDGWSRDVELPAGSRWYSWWAPTVAIAGGTTVTHGDTDTSRIPVYVREGSIVPMEIRSEVTGVAGAWAADALTLLVWPGLTGSSFTVLEEGDAADAPLQVAAACDAGGVCTVEVGAAARDVLLRVLVSAPGPITVDGTALEVGGEPSSEGGAAWDSGDGFVWVRLGPASATRQVLLGPPTR